MYGYGTLHVSFVTVTLIILERAMEMKVQDNSFRCKIIRPEEIIVEIDHHPQIAFFWHPRNAKIVICSLT